MRRLWLPAAIAAVTIGTAGLWLAGGGSANAGTISGTLYRDPDSQVVRWLAANPGDSRAALIRDRIGIQPQARWFTSPNTSATTSAPCNPPRARTTPPVRMPERTTRRSPRHRESAGNMATTREAVSDGSVRRSSAVAR